jgi:hypothetical protein
MGGTACQACRNHPNQFTLQFLNPFFGASYSMAPYLLKINYFKKKRYIAMKKYGLIVFSDEKSPLYGGLSFFNVLKFVKPFL